MARPFVRTEPASADVPLAGNRGNARPGRRRFLKDLAIAATLPGVLGASGKKSSAVDTTAGETVGPLPSLQLGAHRISRLVAGSNPFHGGSYQGPHTDQAMREYFTVERKVEFLQRCERAGITAHQFSGPQHGDYLKPARERGVTMPFFGLADSITSLEGVVRNYAPIAVVHHGGVTDRLFGQGKQGQVHDFVKAAHDRGVMAGVSTHNPDCLKRMADEGWEADFFMACLYFLTRSAFPGAMEKAPPVPTLEISMRFYASDPAAMTAVVRQVKQPCLVFKILAGGRAAVNSRQVNDAFRYAFSNIKPTDGVIVGMYPRYTDEITFNANAARRHGKLVAPSSTA